MMIYQYESEIVEYDVPERAVGRGMGDDMSGLAGWSWQAPLSLSLASSGAADSLSPGAAAATAGDRLRSLAQSAAAKSTNRASLICV
jgi:hypothetical protein